MSHGFMVAMLTGVCESYDWFINKQNPMWVPLKNAQRGYSTYHNPQELEAISQLFGLPTDHQWSYPTLAKGSRLTGVHTRSNPFFRVDVLPKGCRAGQPAIPPLVDDSHEPLSTAEAVSLRHGGLPVRFWREGSGSQWYIAEPPIF